MITPELRTARLVLDRVRASDEDAVLAACQDPELQRYTVVPVPYGREDAAGFVGAFADEAEVSPDVTLWAIRRDTAFIGVIELREPRPRVGQLGFWLSTAERGVGLMTEAVTTVTGHALAPQGAGFETVEWIAVVGNVGSARVAQRAGFHYTGIRPGIVEIRGEHFDGWTAERRAGVNGEGEPWPL